ncbi:MAG: hypothetical protein ACRD1D_11080, partial [Acidimicrobiales bacterium]
PDLAVAKLIAGREQDYTFCRALVSTGLVDVDVISARLASTPAVDRAVRARVALWLEAQAVSGPE